MVFGYTSSHNNESLTSEDPLVKLIALGCNEVIEEQKNLPDKPMFNNLLKSLNENDMLIITSLDEITSSLDAGFTIVKNLVEKGVKINILNLGVFDNTETGKNLLNMFSMYLVLNRFQNIPTNNTKNTKIRTRSKKYNAEKIDAAIALLKTFGGNLSYKEVVEETGISKSTLLRAVNMRRVQNDWYR